MVRRERQGNNGSAVPPGQRWHLPAEPSTLARLVLSRSGTSQGEAPPHRIHTTPVPTCCDVEYAAHVHERAAGYPHNSSGGKAARRDSS